MAEVIFYTGFRRGIFEIFPRMKTASIETIRSIQSHPNAEKLELVKVRGWQCVVKKGEFSEGQRIVFVPVDTILPHAEWSRFLVKDGHSGQPIRLRTARLRGEYSQGLVLPLTVLPSDARKFEEGADVGDLLGVSKYEKEIPAGLAGIAIGGFPVRICPQTDEENGLAAEDIVRIVLEGGISVTRKLDGSSCTVVVEDRQIMQVCSRKLSLKESPESGYWRVARSLRLSELPLGNVVIQGELMGPKIQGNQLKLSEGELHVFQVRIGESFLPYEEMRSLCHASLLCPAVPLIGHYDPPHSLETLQELADSQRLDDGAYGEGVVIRPYHYPRASSGRPLGFKLINRNYVD